MTMRSLLPLVLVALLGSCAGLALGDGRGANSTLGFLLSTSYALDATPPNCTTLDSDALCNATTTCFWLNESCLERSLAVFPVNTTELVPFSWCFNHFPAPFITSIYFLASFLFGLTISGLVYNFIYYDVYTIVLETGERVFNTNFYKTSRTNTYLALVFISAGLLAISTFMNWMDESSCLYIYMVYIFIGVLMVPVVAVPLFFVVIAVLKAIRGTAEISINIDDFCRPSTAVAAADPLKCQVRMM